MGYIELLAAIVIVSCLPVCVPNRLELSVEQHQSPRPTHCRGTNCPLALLEEIYYVGVIQVGSNKQKIFVMFDTGSSLLWVASSIICQNNTQYCRKHLTYDHTKSHTYKADGTPATIEYVDGEVQGVYSSDDIYIGGLKLSAQKFVEVTSIKLQDDYSSGIFGLGFPQNGAPDPPFIKMARTKVIDSAVFAFYFSRNKRSELTLGGANPSHFIPPLVYVPVAYGIHWAISIDQILVNNVQIARAVPAIVDSGCTHIAGPNNLIDPINKFLGRRDSEGMVYPDCNKMSTFPVVTFVINRVKFVMNPADYVLKKRRCESGFTVAEGITQLILGNVWMTKFYTVFDVDERRIGFATAK